MAQDMDGALAEVEDTFHRKHYRTIHINTGKLSSGINRSKLDRERARYWMERASDFED